MTTYIIQGADGHRYHADEATAVEWVRQGRIERATQVSNGVDWMRADAVPALAAAFPPPVISVTAEQTNNLNRMSWGLGCLGLLTCLIFWPAGVVLLIIAVVMSAFVYLKKRQV